MITWLVLLFCFLLLDCSENKCPILDVRFTVNAVSNTKTNLKSLLFFLFFFSFFCRFLCFIVFFSFFISFNYRLAHQNFSPSLARTPSINWLMFSRSRSLATLISPVLPFMVNAFCKFPLTMLYDTWLFEPSSLSSALTCKEGLYDRIVNFKQEKCT